MKKYTGMTRLEIGSLIGTHCTFMTKPITLKPSANGILLPYVWRCLLNGKYTIERLAGNDLPPFKLAMSGKHTGKAYHITRRGEKTAGRRRTKQLLATIAQ